MVISPDDLMRKALERALERPLPESTYRLQFHAGFTFADARAIVDYLHDLGVTHVYASPYLQARPGSLHGYDITNHAALNPEIGTAEAYDAFVAALHERGMGQILDIVPNHMGIVGNGNAWWNDVLENGPLSAYAGYFDIAWQDAPRPALNNRVLLPVLGAPYGKALEAQQICLAFQEGAFVIQYFEHRFPVAPHSYAVLLNHALADLEQKLEATDPFLIEYQSILTAVTHLPHGDETDPARIAEQRREKEVVKRRLAALAQDAVEVRSAIATTITLYNGQPGDPHSFDLLDRFLGQQAYRLSYWRVAADEINYRRFFDVNELAALSTEKLEVFLATHDLVLRLLCQGKIDGLRVDHPDGLFDPREYLSRLQQYYLLGMARAALGSDPPDSEEWQEAEAALLKRGTPHACAAGSLPGDKPLYVVVEKILGPAEELPADWHTHGTTGYEFLGAINGVFLDRRGEEPLSQLYRQWTGTDQRFADLVYHKKSLILRDTLSSELHMLGRQLDRLAQKSRHSRDFTGNSLRFALREIIAFFPLYRSYISDEGVHESDRRQVELAVARAMRHNPTVSGALFRFVRDVLLLVYPDSATDEERAEQRRVAGKFQQVTSPVMAKGVEDTAFYVYNRLLSLNEVGGDPSRFGTAPESLHQYLQSRQAHWPHALSTLSTHDTKRSEDVRARLNVLSELPQEWQENVTRWKHLNEPHRTVVDDAPAPDANEEYLIYQTLLGAWPIEPCSGAAYSHFIERIQAYMTKAIHEAKVHTSWINPDEAYDEAVRRFVERIMDPNTGAAFLREFAMFQRRVSHFGLINSLAQTLLKLTAPGVPDTYQGTELWDFSLADPDNRRPVDYDRREKALRDLDHLIDQAGADRARIAHELLAAKEDGRIKLFVTAQALRCRRQHAGLFTIGEYLPAFIEGSESEHVFAFARRLSGMQAVVAVPRLVSQMDSDADGLPLGASAWKNTRLLVPGIDPDLRWRQAFTGQLLSANRVGKATGFSMALAEVFADFPVALLVARENRPGERS